MEPRNHRLSWTGIALLALPFVPDTPAEAYAQAVLAPATDAFVNATIPTRAEEMERQGMDLLRHEAGWLAAAVLLESAALLRPETDARSITLLEIAARTYHHAGDVERARLTLLTAGERATELGEPRRAADAYLAAAEIAHASRMTREAITALVRVFELSQTPELSERDRLSLWRRLGLPDDERLRVAGKGS